MPGSNERKQHTLGSAAEEYANQAHMLYHLELSKRWSSLKTPAKRKRVSLLRCTPLSESISQASVYIAALRSLSSGFHLHRSRHWPPQGNSSTRGRRPRQDSTLVCFLALHVLHCYITHIPKTSKHVFTALCMYIIYIYIVNFEPFGH